MTIPRSLRLCALERRFRNVVNMTSLATALWTCAERVLGPAVEFVELFFGIAPNDGTAPPSLYRSYVSLGPNDVNLTPAFRPGDAVAGLFLDDRRIAFLDTASVHHHSEGNEHRAIVYARSQVLAAPLWRGDMPQGGLVIGLGGTAGEDPEKRRLAVALARRLRLLLLQRLSTCLALDSQMNLHHGLITLLDLLQDFGTHRNPTQIGALALDFFVTELGFRRALLARIDPESQTLYGTDSRGFEDVCRLVRFPYESGNDYLSMSARAGRPTVHDVAPEDEHLPVFLHERGIRQVLLLPMRVEDEMVGVMMLDNDPLRQPLPADYLELLQRMADLLGQSLYVSSIYETLRRTAETDPLTGVFNRLALQQLLEEEIPRVKRFGQSLSILMIDLCDFKKFNDMYGHVVGDRILKTVAKLLVSCTRKTDKVVRFGGDEFLVFMPNTTEERAQMVRRRVELAVREHNDKAQSEQDIFMLSIGLRSADANNVDRILEDADEEMYKKKAMQSRQKLYNAFTSNNQEELHKSDNFVAVLIKNLLEREPHFLDHARMVMVWSQAICQVIGADDDFIERVSLAALLHDIGKIALPSGLLTKAQPLTKEDRRHIRLHPMAGSDFLSGHQFLGDLRIIINHHHERWDGRTSGPHPGYPSGLSGELIPLGSRIIHIAETFDDLVSPRPYRPVPYTTYKALDILREEADKAFDPRLVSVFCDYVEMINKPLATLGVMEM